VAGREAEGLFEARAIPHADRIAVSGPDISVSARAAQSLSLLFFELASHSDEGLSLVGKHPHIVAHWEVTGEEPDTIFHFRWEEFNTSAATRRRIPILVSSCLIGSRRRRSAAARSGILPTQVTSMNSPRRWSPSWT